MRFQRELVGIPTLPRRRGEHVVHHHVQHGLSAGGTDRHLLHPTLEEQPLDNALEPTPAVILQRAVKVLEVVADHGVGSGETVLEILPRILVQVQGHGGEESFGVGLALVVEGRNFDWIGPIGIAINNGIMCVLAFTDDQFSLRLLFLAQINFTPGIIRSKY